MSEETHSTHACCPKKLKGLEKFVLAGTVTPEQSRPKDEKRQYMMVAQVSVSNPIVLQVLLIVVVEKHARPGSSRCQV